MDLHNNRVGLKIGQQNPEKNIRVIIHKVFQAIENGECRQVARDSLNRFVDAQGNPIAKKKLKRNWNNGRILEPTSFQRTKK
jgi:hypothetical protein